MFTAAQISAIIMLLQAFGVGSSTIAIVQKDLGVSSQATVIVATSTPPAIITNSSSVPQPIIQPDLSQPIQVQAPVSLGSAPVQPVSIGVKFRVSSGGSSFQSDASGATVSVGSELRFEVTTFDSNGVYAKIPVTVDTADPDLLNEDPNFKNDPSLIGSLNGPGKISWIDFVTKTTGDYTFSFTQQNTHEVQTFTVSVH